MSEGRLTKEIFNYMTNIKAITKWGKKIGKYLVEVAINSTEMLKVRCFE